METIRVVSIVAALFAATGCGAAEDAHFALKLSVTLEERDGMIPFVQPNGAVTEYAREDVVGRPYVYGVFKGGFAPGNDKPLFSQWGRIPEDLHIEIPGPRMYEDGKPYDSILVVYMQTDVPSADNAPFLKTGDLSAFTVDTTQLRDGDPDFQAGAIRRVIDGQDAVLSLQNRLPGNFDDPADSMIDTIMVVP